jgi:hypothetical protein
LKTENYISGGIGRISGHHLLLFDIAIRFHIKLILAIFCFVAFILGKTENYQMSKIWGV